ncbi:hypothetical protein AT15_03800 [Kosmotoga arenicorallina S304]|uniref:Uncharacterized protein n=1 Tax=Kosmotoga arenicorallina S304 TaxID=1453497 RepID=A0A182C847_9BACT|nr:DUF6577 family protein [Kosmotoga arenicorallina]OAA31958.1 hypothetical protein AT15_03800 [Kosmotoga arenicorallina S304]
MKSPYSRAYVAKRLFRLRESGVKYISKKELVKYFKKQNPKISDSTIRRRIYDLKKSGVITNSGRGQYLIENRPSFLPPDSAFLKKVVKSLTKRFPYLSNYCIWETKWLSEFTVHQASLPLVILEVERDTEESVFNFLKESYNNIFLKPGIKEVEKYFAFNEKNIVVIPLISQSPISKIGNIKIPKTEKILVDLFCEKNLFIAYQGQELINIYKNVIKKYAFNRTTFWSYAKRRKRYNQIRRFILENHIEGFMEEEN